MYRAAGFGGGYGGGAHSFPARSRAPATTAWPRLTPPSLGGTREWVSTRNPVLSSTSTVTPRSSRFWNTPPDSATVPSPDDSRSRRQTWPIMAATP